MDISLLITVGIIFLSTLLVSALSALRRDRCLADFDRFHVTVERRGKRPVYGTMCLVSTGFEMSYREEVLDDQMHMESSYLFYRADYPNILAVYRNVDDLFPENRERRDRAYARAFRPNLVRRVRRSLTNFVNTATDSLTQALGVVLGGSRMVQARVLAPGQTEVKGLARELLTTVGTKYDPLLERLIGAEAVVHVVRGEQEVEYMGVLKGYTTEFIELMDVYVPQPLVMGVTCDATIAAECADGNNAEHVSARRTLQRDVCAQIANGHVVVRNLGERPLLLSKVEINGDLRRVNALVDADQEVRYPVGDATERVELTVQVVLRFDLIVPRTLSAIRHRASRYDPLHILGAPVVLEPLQSTDEEEKAARTRLDADGDDAEAMVNLAAVLAGLGRFAEAAEWLDGALSRSPRLPDGGALARLLLELVQGELGRSGPFVQLLP